MKRLNLTQTETDIVFCTGGIAKMTPDQRKAKAHQVPGGSSPQMVRQFGGKHWEEMMPSCDYLSALEKTTGIQISSLFFEWDADAFEKLWNKMLDHSSTPMMTVCLLLLGEKAEEFISGRGEAEQKRTRFLLGLCQSYPDLAVFV